MNSFSYFSFIVIFQNVGTCSIKPPPSKIIFPHLMQCLISDHSQRLLYNTSDTGPCNVISNSTEPVEDKYKFSCSCQFIDSDFAHGFITNSRIVSSAEIQKVILVIKNCTKPNLKIRYNLVTLLLITIVFRVDNVHFGNAPELVPPANLYSVLPI